MKVDAWKPAPPSSLGPRPTSDDGVSRWLAVATITDHG